MAEPDLDAFYDQLCSRYAWDYGALTIGPTLTSGTNPPYSAADFFALYPKFGGKAASYTDTITITANSPVVTSIATQGLSAGMLVSGAGIPAGTTIQSVDSDTQITLSVAATANGTALNVYSTPLLPMAVINAYIALASASLMQARWQDAWVIAMGWFVAHFATLWLRSEGTTTGTPGQAAAAGLARGITVSKSAGGVSAGVQPAPGLEAWAGWNLTEYGVQLSTLAKVIGSGPMWIY